MLDVAQEYLPLSRHSSALPYVTGEYCQRPWGSYMVINAGSRRNMEFCEKRIIIDPGKALSLQRHQGRSEKWYVLEGEVNMIIDTHLQRKRAGDKTDVPRRAIHTLVNLGERPVVIYERQEGLCRENDNQRLYDINGRATEMLSPADPLGWEAIRLYKNLTALIA